MKLPPVTGLGEGLATQGGDEENPQDIQYGEAFAAQMINAVLQSPLWPRTLLVWLYDEHGGYYDHVPPPAAIKPDAVAPRLNAGDVVDGYDVYGPRVPAVVVSPYSRPHAVSNVVCDHTSVLATIEAKWNLPACTYRDANAATVAGFLDPSKLAFPEPPTLAAAADPLPGALRCSNADPMPVIHPGKPPGTGGPAPARQRLIVRWRGRRHGHGNAPVVAIRTSAGRLSGLTIELRRGRHVVARSHVAHVSTHTRTVVLAASARGRIPSGRYRLVVLRRGRIVLGRTVRLV